MVISQEKISVFWEGNELQACVYLQVKKIAELIHDARRRSERGKCKEQERIIKAKLSDSFKTKVYTTSSGEYSYGEKSEDACLRKSVFGNLQNSDRLTIRPSFEILGNPMPLGTLAATSVDKVIEKIAGS